MEIKFSDKISKQMKKIILKGTWWYKTGDFLKYDLWFFFRNLWLFRKEIYRHRPWDCSYSLTMLRRSLEIQCKTMDEKSYEIESSKSKKVIKMKRAIEILKWHEDNLFLELAEKKLGLEYKVGDWEFVPVEKGELNEEITKGETYYSLNDNLPEEDKDNNKKISDLSIKIENDSWIELFQILQGKDYEGVVFESDEDWENFFDGSGMKGWWS